MEKIKLTKETKVLLLKCIKDGWLDLEIFNQDELRNCFMASPITKAEAKAHLNEFLAENMDEYIREHMTRSQALEHADRLKRAEGWNGM